MEPANTEITKLSNGDIVMWIESESSLHLKCITKHGDPVELNTEEIKELCDVLQQLAKLIE